LFADEPTGNLDAETSEMVVELLFELNREAGTTLVLVTHNMELAGETGRVIRLAKGHIIEDGGKSPDGKPGTYRKPGTDEKPRTDEKPGTDGTDRPSETK
jgi:energy-coupling factor transporter ATP-binding protein EcfA2